MNSQASGIRLDQRKHLLINALELLYSCHLRTSDRFAVWQEKRVLMASDHTATVAYISRHTGTQSMTLIDLTFDLFNVVRSLEETLRARHLPSRPNRTADLLPQSRQIVNTE